MEQESAKRGRQETMPEFHLVSAMTLIPDKISMPKYSVPHQSVTTATHSTPKHSPSPRLSIQP
jgi:hypothetical protein